MSTLFGLFNLKALSLYSLQRYRQSDAQSLVLSATIIARLSAALCYNFIGMSKISNTSFLVVN